MNDSEIVSIGMLRPLLIAVDPGKTCGVAAFDGIGRALHCGDISIDKLWDFLDYCNAARVAVESWMLYPKMAPKLYWHTFPAPEAIGVCRAWTSYMNKPLHRIAPRSRKPFDSMVPQGVLKSYHCHDAVAVGLALRKELDLFEEPDWDEVVRRLKSLL